MDSRELANYQRKIKDHIRAGQWEKADKIIRTVIREKPSRIAPFYYQRGVVLLCLKRYEKSGECFLQAYKQDSRYSKKIIYELKRGYRKTVDEHKWRVALKFLDYLTRLDGDNSASYYYKHGAILLKQEEYESAIVSLKQSWLKSSKYQEQIRDILQARYNHLIPQEKWEQAILIVDFLLEVQSSQGDLHYRKGLLMRKLGQKASAVHELQIAQEMDNRYDRMKEQIQNLLSEEESENEETPKGQAIFDTELSQSQFSVQDQYAQSLEEEAPAIDIEVGDDYGFDPNYLDTEDVEELQQILAGEKAPPKPETKRRPSGEVLSKARREKESLASAVDSMTSKHWLAILGVGLFGLFLGWLSQPNRSSENEKQKDLQLEILQKQLESLQKIIQDMAQNRSDLPTAEFATQASITDANKKPRTVFQKGEKIAIQLRYYSKSSESKTAYIKIRGRGILEIERERKISGKEWQSFFPIKVPINRTGQYKVTIEVKIGTFSQSQELEFEVRG